MDNAKVEYAAKAAGAISALAALCTLSITLVQIRNDYQKAQIREWQEVVVYSMIADAAGAGMTTTELQNKYRGAAVDLPQELPREEIQTQALKRTLLNLISK